MVAACGGNGSSSSVTAPGAPTLDSATAGDTQAVLAFTASTSGGTATTYSGDCKVGTTTKSIIGSSSPITVTGMTNGTAYTCTVMATNSAGSATSASKNVTPVAGSSGGGGTSTTTDTTKLPVGDTKMLSTAPTSSQKGYLYLCNNTNGNGPGNTAKGPWFNSDGTTWNLLTKNNYLVQGAVSWAAATFQATWGSSLNVSGNGLPSHTTGIFGITAATSPAAYEWDQNGNKIGTNTIAWGLSASPTVASTPGCIKGGAIGVLITGARLFGAMDAKSRDAAAWEVPDLCNGHPAPNNSSPDNGIYHYHMMPSCGLAADVTGQHSALIGYVADGFGLYGNLGESGTALTNNDLDECHGHTHAITVNGATVTQYHYHSTPEFPYTVGCYRGTAVTTN
jgi:hypothetical protein